MQCLKILQCSVTDTTHVFLVPYDNYQYNLACLGLWNVFVLSRSSISQQFLLSDWCSYIVLRMRVQMLNEIFFAAWIHNNITIAWIFFIFRHARSLFLALIIVTTQSLFIFIRFLVARNCYVDAFQLLPIHISNSRLNFFVGVFNCFIETFFSVGVRLNSFGT